jgi:hypothetical protein
VQEEAVCNPPLVAAYACDGVITQRAEVWRVLDFAAEIIIKLGARRGDCNKSDVLAIPPGKRVYNGVEPAWAVLHSKIVAKQLANPIVLWNSGEPLVQHEL